MDSILRFFIERHLLVNVIAGGLVVIGFISASNLEREFIPGVTVPRIFITANLPGASARDMETKITVPIEEALEEVAGIDHFTTIISDNTSFTTVELYEDYETAQIEAAEVDLRAAVDGITDFPPEMEDEPTLRLFNPGRELVIEVLLNGPQPALGEIAEDLEDRIRRLDTVGEVAVLGLPDPEVRILVDPALAREHSITLAEVITAVQRRNVSSTGGILESPAERRQVVMWSRFEDPADVGETILRFQPDSGVLRIRDIARIEKGREDTGLITHSNGKRGVVLFVKKREDIDIIDTVQQVRDLVAATPIPRDIEVSTINDESFIVSNRLELMFANGLIGILLVAGVLYLFVRPGPAIWILIGIPVVFMAALILVGPMDMTLNLMSLTGFIVVLGLVVDDAVVVAERIVFNQATGLSPTQAALTGAREMLAPVTAAALTTVLAFLPLTMMGGVPGRIIWQISAVVVFVLLFSLIESFLILPAHLSSMSVRTKVHKRRFMEVLEFHYRRALHWILRHRLTMLAIALTAFAVVMVFVRPLVPFVLFPQTDADRLLLKITTPPGTSLEQTEAVTADVTQQIMRITAKELEGVTGRIGHQNTGSLEKQFGEADNEALLIVQFRRFGRTYSNAQWMERLPEQIKTPDDVDILYQSEYFGPPTDLPVTVHVLSNDDTLRRGVAFEIEHYLKNTPGVVEVEVDERPGTPKIELNLNYEKLALRGLDPETVGLTLAAAFHGIEASEHRDLDNTTELRVQFDPAARGDLDALLETPVRARTSELVRLRDVVEPREVPALTRIYHRDGFRSATVRASFLESSDLTALAFAQRMEDELFPRFANLPGLFVSNGGEATETQKTTGRMGTAALLAVVGITVVIWVMLGSLIEALFVMLVIPLAVAGVLLVFFLHGQALSMFAMLGTIGLAGIVVNGAIVMVDAIHRRVNSEGGPSLDDANEKIIDAVTERLRPIMVTTLTTLGGVLPSAYGIGGYDTIVSIVSLAIGWGLAVSTLVTLFLVPILYSLASDLRRWRRGSRHAPARLAKHSPVGPESG